MRSRLAIPPQHLKVHKATVQEMNPWYRDTHLIYLSPLSIRNACSHVLLQVQTCLSLWEIPYHLSLEESAAHFCRCNRAVSMRNNVSIIQVNLRYPLSVSQVMKLYSEVASMT